MLTCNKDELNLINTFIFDKYIVDTYICSLKFNLNDVILQEGETIDKMMVDYEDLVQMAKDNKFCYSIQRRIGFYLKEIKEFINKI